MAFFTIYSFNFSCNKLIKLLKIIVLIAGLVIISSSVFPQIRPYPSSKQIGINISGNNYWSTQIPFADVFKTSSQWTFNGDWSGGNASQFPLDAQGYPIEILPGQKAETLMMRAMQGYYPGGKYVVTYEGTGKVDLKKFDVISSVKPKPGRIEVMVKPGNNGLALEILESKKGDHIRNIHVWLPGLENISSEFNPKFIKLLQPFGAFRFMDFQKTNNNPLIKWQDRPLLSDSRYTGEGGVPLEMMIKLANMAQINPWFSIPHQANDDFVKNFAITVKKLLDPKLKVYVEYSNEVWNTQFTQAKYAREKGIALQLSTNPYQAQLRYYSQRSVEIFKIWEQVFGKPSRLVRVMASQAVNPWVSNQVMSWKDARNHVDALAMGGYFGLKPGAYPDEMVAMQTVDWVLAKVRENVDIDNVQWIRSQASVARNYNVKLVAYEGGQHLVSNNGSNPAVTKLFIAANRHPKMYNLYQRHLNHWFAQGGNLYMIFSFVGLPSKSGSWGSLEYLDQPLSQAHKYRAIVDFIKQAGGSLTSGSTTMELSDEIHG